MSQVVLMSRQASGCPSNLAIAETQDHEQADQKRREPRQENERDLEIVHQTLVNGPSTALPPGQRRRHPSIGSLVWFRRCSRNACGMAIRSGAVRLDTSGRVRADSTG